MTMELPFILLGNENLKLKEKARLTGELVHTPHFSLPNTPIPKGSETLLKSGMLFQVDNIPSVKGYPGVSAEGGIVLADKELKNEIRATYPEVWQRMDTRKAYVRDVLGINTHEDILFSGNATPYLRPFALNKEMAMVWTDNNESDNLKSNISKYLF